MNEAGGSNKVRKCLLRHLDQHPNTRSCSRARPRSNMSERILRIAALVVISLALIQVPIFHLGKSAPRDKAVAAGTTILQAKVLDTHLLTKPTILGHNEDWFSMVNGSYFFKANSAEIDRTWDSLLNRFPLHRLRLHVGNRYNWKQTIGTNRIGQYDLYGRQMPTAIGLDETLRWAESLKDKPEIMLIASPFFGSDQDAADMVAYANSTSGYWADLRAQNGHPQPYHVKYWLMGNETDMESQTIDDYLGSVKRKAQLMRAVDPSIKIFANTKTLGPRTDDWYTWNRRVLSEAGPLIDGIDMHVYYDGNSISLATQDIDALLKDIQTYAPAAKRASFELSISEHAKWPSDINDKTTWTKTRSLRGAIATADFLMEVLRRPGISGANYWGFAQEGPWKVAERDEQGNKFPTAISHLYYLFNRALGSSVRPVNVYSPPIYAENGVEVPHVTTSLRSDWSVNAILFENPDKTTHALVTVNWSTLNPYTVHLSQNVVPPGSRYKIRKLLLSGPDLESFNTFANQPVTVTETEAPAQVNDFAVPKQSVVAWIFEPATTSTQGLSSIANPSNLTVIRSGGALNLTWSASTGSVSVAGYRIERSTDQSNWKQIVSTANVSYSNTLNALNTRYYYRVRAYDATGNTSGYSNIASGIVGGLKANNSLVSVDGRFKLVYQGDGNLVLYRNRDHAALWSSKTNDMKPGTTIMQGDGNLVVRDASAVAVWSSRTNGHPSSRLIVQTDGNAVIYDPSNKPLWATWTQGKY